MLFLPRGFKLTFSTKLPSSNRNSIVSPFASNISANRFERYAAPSSPPISCVEKTIGEIAKPKMTKLSSCLVVAEGDVHGPLGPLPLPGHVLQGLQDSEDGVLVVDGAPAVNPFLN